MQKTILKTHKRSFITRPTSAQMDEVSSQSKNAEQIESLLKNALELDPKLTQAHLQLGILYARREDYTRASVEFEQSVKLDPDLAVAHYRLGQALMHLGERDQAAHEMETFRKLDSAQKTDDTVTTFLMTRQDKTE